jgi:Ribonuclease G/E
LTLIQKVYHRLMKTFTVPNGCDITEIVTDNGVTVYVAASIPAEVMQAWHKRLERRLAQSIKESAAADESLDRLLKQQK